MTRQLSLAIRRADDDLASRRDRWGQTQLLGVTRTAAWVRTWPTTATTRGPTGAASARPRRLRRHQSIRPSRAAHRPVRGSGCPRVAAGTARCAGRGRLVTRRVPVGIYSTLRQPRHGRPRNFDYYSGDTRGRRAGGRGRDPPGRACPGLTGRHQRVRQQRRGRHDLRDPVQRPRGPILGRRKPPRCRLASAGPSRHDPPSAFACASPGGACAGSRPAAARSTHPWIARRRRGSEEGRTIFYYDGLAHEGDRLRSTSTPGRQILALDESGSVPQAVRSRSSVSGNV